MFCVKCDKVLARGDSSCHGRSGRTRRGADAASPPARSRAGVRRALGVGAAVALGVLLFVHDPAKTGLFPSCPLHEVTGLQCPGCGTTRALHALLHGEPVTALRFNPILALVIPLAVTALAGAFRPRAAAAPDGVSAWARRALTGPAALAVLICYGVVRNIPGLPTRLLSPP